MDFQKKLMDAGSRTNPAKSYFVKMIKKLKTMMKTR